MSPEEISEAFGTDLEAVRIIIAFAEGKEFREALEGASGPQHLRTPESWNWFAVP